jgi:hypothetical protein
VLTSTIVGELSMAPGVRWRRCCWVSRVRFSTARGWEGIFHESLNLINLESASVVCRREQMAGVASARDHACQTIENGANYGVQGSFVDGNDVEAKRGNAPHCR